MKRAFVIMLIFGLPAIIAAQNIAITDDDAYTANSSAMLDVKSVSKGLLIPRMTTIQRTNIVSPANSLLVYDSDISAYFYWTGSSWMKIGTSNNDYWLPDGSNIYFTAGNVGVGTTSPGRKMIVKGSSTNLNEAIFAVQNTDGDTVFAVYPEGVRVWVNDDGGSKASGNRGGFAVGGYCPSKAGFTNEYLRVTPDSVRVYIDDEFIGSKASGNRGGFAVGGFCPSKGTTTDHYLFVQDDSTRVYVADSLQGFGVENIEGVTDQRIMKLTTENYFIGHEAGRSITAGKYNSFIGYQSGNKNTTGYKNYFIGYRTGYNNTGGNSNIFIGDSAGFTNVIGAGNVYLGNQTGYLNTGNNNVIVGYQAGKSLTSGNENVIIGTYTNIQNGTGDYNVLIGNSAGYNSPNLTDGNTIIGEWAGMNMTTAGSLGLQNCFYGFGAGFLASGEKNVYVGAGAGGSCHGNNNIIIGNSTVGNHSGTFSNRIWLGNDNIETLYCKGPWFSTTTEAPNMVIDATGKIMHTTSSVPIGSGATNKIAFWTGSGSLSYNNNLHWDNTYSNLGIGTSAPFSPGGSSARVIHLRASDYPQYILEAYNATPDNKIWRMIARSSNVLQIQTLDDAAGSEITGMEFTRSGNSITKVVFPNGNIGIGATAPANKLHVVDNLVSNDNPAVYGIHAVTDYCGIGVRGEGKYKGIDGIASTAVSTCFGIIGTATATSAATAYGVYGNALGSTSGTKYGVYGTASGTGTNWAGYFSGNVNVTGTLSKGGGSFKIDHPLDPENKYLYHSFVESPDMMNIYNGIIILDSQGKATVDLPDYFEALNNEFRYTLTPIGAPAPNLYIEQEVATNHFKIAGGNPGMKVSWQVTGIRKDPFAVKNRIPVEVDKTMEEKGLYLYPDVYKQPLEKGIDYKNIKNNSK